MTLAQWALENGRPAIEVVPRARGGWTASRTLLADTGAGSLQSGFEIVLDESDCSSAGGQPAHAVTLGRAYRGSFPVYWVRVQVPGTQFNRRVRAVGVPAPPPGFNGIACFRFLNRFTYGNFGDPNRLGLET